VSAEVLYSIPGLRPFAMEDAECQEGFEIANDWMIDNYSRWERQGTRYLQDRGENNVNDAANTVFALIFSADQVYATFFSDPAGGVLMTR